MPTKMATCCKDKAVFVAVYVETPRKRRFSSNNHYHHLHQPKHGGGVYNRRAQLLDYSRHLRESARSGPSNPLNPKPVSSSNQQPMKQITAVGSKPKRGKVPACLGNCKIAIPSFLRSLTTLQAKKQRKTTTKKSRESEFTATKMKSVMKKLRVQKKGAFLSKLLSALQKHR
ncbi:Protein lingerer like [Actinidia chinensis var. chinensis]|uniref:Protein lingerer like n=1 Tax=Actinidia chinensis var. chinensis TaxID=1590841 RepID=A0A2R6QNV4_ACTCC|nr:Protein lingerer like [Actinidia chinensis var. chinensis]